MATYSSNDFRAGLKIMMDGEPYAVESSEFVKPAADAKAIGDNAKWLLDQAECIVTLWNGQPIAVTPPNFVELEIVDTDPGLKGDTAGTGGKPATLSTGAVVKVPLFVQILRLVRGVVFHAAVCRKLPI